MTSIDMNKSIQLSSRVRYRAVDDEGVVVHLDNGQVIVVNGVGLFILQQLDQAKTVNKLVSAMVDKFHISPDTAYNDLVRYLAELSEQQVLEEAPGSASMSLT